MRPLLSVLTLIAALMLPITLGLALVSLWGAVASAALITWIAGQLKDRAGAPAVMGLVAAPIAGIWAALGLGLGRKQETLSQEGQLASATADENPA